MTFFTKLKINNDEFLVPVHEYKSPWGWKYQVDIWDTPYDFAIDQRGNTLSGFSISKTLASFVLSERDQKTVEEMIQRLQETAYFERIEPWN